MSVKPDKPGVLIYGGTFNPLHIGHLRLAVEAKEALGNIVSRVDFVPVKHQPLKNNSHILPFEWRMRMIQTAIGGLFDFVCCDVENSRPGPSYTYDTLINYPGTSCRDDRYFLMGSEDFCQLDKWHRGLELLNIANLVIAPRNGGTFEDLLAVTEKFWRLALKPPEITLMDLKIPAITLIRLHNGAKIYYLNIPYLDISSTAIRGAWLNGRNIAWLVPGGVLEFLDMNRQLVTRVWKGNQ